MNKKSIYLLGILLVIIIGTLAQWFLCCTVCYSENRGLSKEDDASATINNVAAPENKTPTSLPFSIQDANGSLSFSSDENFNFEQSKFSFHDSIGNSINQGIAMLKDYLDANPNKRIDITGYHTGSENNNSAYTNLGLARASTVKNYFAFKGIPPKLINTFGKLNDSIVPDGNSVFHGPLSFDVSTFTDPSSQEDDELKSICEEIKEAPLFLNFETGQSRIQLSEQQKQKFTNISRCVDKLGVNVYVVGHTDNTGTPDGNLKLGLKRANFARNYLVHNGILPQNVLASSEGQNKPIADNTTEEGKAKNRRIEITIK